MLSIIFLLVSVLLVSSHYLIRIKFKWQLSFFSSFCSCSQFFGSTFSSWALRTCSYIACAPFLYTSFHVPSITNSQNMWCASTEWPKSMHSRDTALHRITRARTSYVKYDGAQAAPNFGRSLLSGTKNAFTFQLRTKKNVRNPHMHYT